MNNNRKSVVVAIALSLFALPVAAVADQTDQSLAARVTQLEHEVNNQALVNMATRLDSLQQSVEQLRGEVEMQGHVINQMKQRQRDLYVDIDRRLSQLERQNGISGGSAAAAAPAAATGTATAAVPAVPANAAAAAPANTAAPASANAAAAAPVPAVSTAASDKERAAYQAAFDQLRDLHYDQAIAAFRAFLKQYPNGRYSYIAQYWIAEADYAQRDFKQAIVDYGALIKNFPNNPKVAEAMLKIGYCYYESGDKGEAQKQLSQLVKLYPDSTEAGQASNLLQQMRQDGN